MLKAVLHSENITKKTTRELCNVVSVNISNYEKREVGFTFNGINRILPAATGNTVSPFFIELGGHFFDCEIIFNENNTKITLDYGVIPNQ